MLRLIYGRAGTGKTSFCFNEIKEKINQKEKVYIITPEQFSYMAQRRLLDTVEEDAVMNAEALIFDRMALRVFEEIGGTAEVSLSDSGVSMLLYDILEKQKKNLSFLGKSSKNVTILNRILTELKKHNISKKELENAINTIEDNYTKKKLEDIILLQNAFEKSIPQDYIESTDKLNKLAQKLEQSKIFDNSIMYFDEFAGFTEQEYKIIEILLKKAKQVNITICADCLEDNSNIETDIFYANKQTALKLIDIAKTNNIQIEKPIFLNQEHRFKNNELVHLEKNIFRQEPEIYNKEPKNIELFLAMNPYSEIEHLAQKIVHLVREENYRFRDISVITKDIENYRALTKTIFSEYEIPVFIDEKRDLSQNILVQFLLSIFDIYAKNWTYETVFSYLKTGLANIEKDELYELENYCTKWNIKGNKWYKDDWNFGNLNKEELEKINSIRKKVVEPLIELKNQIIENKSVKAISTKIYYFLKNNGIFENLLYKAEEIKNIGELEIANDYNTSINIIIQVLDEMVDIFGEEKVGFEKYRELLKIGLENKNLGAIPGVQDEVIMGDVDRSRSHKVRAVFILGLNDGVFPSVHKDEGFLDDRDRDILKANNIELAKGTLEKLYDDQFNIYKVLSTAEEKVYLSYTSTDKEGKAIRPSVLLINIKNMFPQLIETSDVISKKSCITLEKPTFNNLLEKIYAWKQGEEIEKIWQDAYKYYSSKPEWKAKLYEAIKGLEYTNVPEKIEKEQISKLYGNKIKTSISQLEKYRSCPFSFHLKYGLKLKDPINSNVQPIDTGNFMHEVIDTFFIRIKDEGIKIKEIDRVTLRKIVTEIIEKKLEISKYYNLTSSAKFRTLISKLKKTILTSMEYIVSQLVNSEFEVLGTEIEFNNCGDYSPITVNLESGQKVEIIGKIDRVDIAENEDGKYIRIIDYKSSVKKINLNEVVYGLQIQLITYLNEMTKEQDAKEAGILYFNLIDSLISSKKKLTEEEIEDELKKRYRMQGLLLEDIKVIKMMDTKLEKGRSDIIPVYIDKDGNISSKMSSSINGEDFKNLQKQVIKNIKEIAKEITNGNIDLKPYYNKSKKTACDYCTYHSICNFNTRNKGNSYSFVPNLTSEEILEKLKLENKGE